jgi:SAM-dependent methyltransferase
MSLAQRIGNLIKRVDKELGFLAVLKGEPRPPRGGFDLQGEKALDWGWVCVNLPKSAKRAMDIGCGESPTVSAMLSLGYTEVVAIDLQFPLDNVLRGPHFIQGDFNQLPLNGSFDVVVACSTVEHIGLSGRYTSTEDADGDLKALRKINKLLSNDGRLILTVPAGEDAVYKPWHRVYGTARISRLLEGFRIVCSQGYVKEPWGPWRRTTLQEALEFPATSARYALAQMVLKVSEVDQIART